MDIYMHQALEKIRNWFDKAAIWQKDLFCTLWESTKKDEKILDREINLIAQEYFGESHRIILKDSFPSELSFSEDNRPPVILKSISNVTGVGALSSDATLNFENGLTVIYGENGCGKSSYVRILKALENHINAENVFGNVFSEHPTPAKADVVFSVDGTDHLITWTKSCKTKYPIQIYDNVVAKQFVDKENEVVYEPKMLSIITQIANICEQISAFYKNKEQEVLQQFIPLQPELSEHPVIKEFEGLSAIKNVENFATRYPWSGTTETELVAIEDSLKEENPHKAAVALDAKKHIICGHEKTILELLPLVDDLACEIFLKKRAQQIATRKVQEAFITATRQESKLEYFGSDEWKAMWTQANIYISLMGAIEEEIPVSKSGRCALCQQELDSSAQARMQKFRQFVASDAMTVAEGAYQQFCEAVSLLQTKIESRVKLTEIAESLEAGTIPEDVKGMILGFYREILSRCMWLLSYVEENSVTFPYIHTESEIKKEFAYIKEKMDTQIIAYKNAGSNQKGQIAHRNKLLAIKWTAVNLQAKVQLLHIQRVLKECKTNTLTTLKKDLSRLLITDEYVKRFQDEMNILDERRQIKVELIEASPKRGKSYHQISLKGAKSVGKHKNGDVLSEGEFRVVSLAAFLADLSAWGRIMPFVFDDPITSLDQRYETKVATRLVQLSLERQVIVFTHRLAFAQLLNVEATNYNIAASRQERIDQVSIYNVQLRKSPLGYPEPPDFLKDVSLVKAIRHIRGNELPAIRRKQNEGDFVAADSMIKSLCSDFRKVIEQGISQDLLSGIVSRYGREISSLKIPRLYAITQEDITLFHNMMSKYSFYEHSQPLETPISLPDITDIEIDLNTMETWAKEYDKRCETAARKAKGKK